MKREPLTPDDIDMLRGSYITEELAQQAGLFRVDSLGGAELVGRNGSGNYSGIVFPYFWPGQLSPREYRLRRDCPDLERHLDDSIKQKQKYLSPPGKSSLLYFMRETPLNWLSDSTLPVSLTEGEKKAIALHRLTFHNSPVPHFLPVGLAGVWNWRGIVGKTFDQHGARQSVKGVIPDFDRIVWTDRLVYIIFDVNVITNESVSVARRALAEELARRGANVRFVNLPQQEGVNGVDDLLAANGPDYVLGLIAGAQPSEARVERKSQATKIVELAKAVDLFHTTDDEPYASFEVSGHLETWQVKSQGFRDWLTRRLFDTENKAPASQSLQEALSLLGSRARYASQAREVHLRLAQHDDAIYIDLADVDWRVVRVTAYDWKVIASSEAPVRFRRTKGMLALPQPQRGGGIDALRRFINVPDVQWPLLAGYLVACYRPGRPFPVLVLHGEQGSAKSTTARVLRWLIDPNKAALRSEPKDERDLIIAATNCWLVALDNLSRIPPWLSDAFCRLATGGGFGTRKLYENDEETLFDAMRPVLLNGIEELATRSDLLDRTLMLTLPPIPDDKRRTEKELWGDFERERPAIFGALLDAVSCALRNESNVHLGSLPRMADFAQWAVAAEPALGLDKGDFMRAYTGNRESANDLALEASPASASVVAFVAERGRWKGTTSELLAELNSRVSDELRKQYGWPKSANTLGGFLTRLSPNLRAVGIRIERGSGRQRRMWMLEKSDYSLSRLSHPSPDLALSQSECDSDGSPNVG